MIGQQPLQIGQTFTDQGQKIPRTPDVTDHQLQIVAFHRLGVAFAKNQA